MGYEHIIVAAFGHQSRVDDQLCENLYKTFANHDERKLMDAGQRIAHLGSSRRGVWQPQEVTEGKPLKVSMLYGFSEVCDAIEAGQMLPIDGDQHVPSALRKMRQYGLQNPIIEVS